MLGITLVLVCIAVPLWIGLYGIERQLIDILAELRRRNNA